MSLIKCFWSKPLSINSLERNCKSSGFEAGFVSRTSSIGSTLFNKIENKNSDLIIFYKIEYKQDHSEKAKVQASLISDTSNTIYSYNYNVPYNYFMKIEMGLNIKTHRDLNIYSKLSKYLNKNAKKWLTSFF